MLKILLKLLIQLRRYNWNTFIIVITFSILLFHYFIYYIMVRSYDARSYDLKRAGSKVRPLKQALTSNSCRCLVNFLHPDPLPQPPSAAEPFNSLLPLPTHLGKSLSPSNHRPWHQVKPRIRKMSLLRKQQLQKRKH